MLLEVGLIGIQHTVEPWEQLLRAVIGVEHDGNAVRGSNRANVVCAGHSAGNAGLLLAIGNTLFHVVVSVQIF